MAEQPAKKKRRIKNPESFRERIQKSSEASAKPSRSARLTPVRRAASWLFRPITRLYASKPLKPVRKVLSVVGKVVFPKYFRQSWQELKQTSWPNWQESRRLTSAVLIFAIVFGAAIALVDWGLDKVFKQLLLK